MTFISIFCVCVFFFFKPMLKTNSCIFRCLTGWGKYPSNRWVQLSLYLKLFWLCELVVAALTAWTHKIQASIQQTVVYSQSGVNIPKHLSPGASGAKHGCTVPSHILHARSHTHTHTDNVVYRRHVYTSGPVASLNGPTIALCVNNRNTVISAARFRLRWPLALSRSCRCLLREHYCSSLVLRPSIPSSPSFYHFWTILTAFLRKLHQCSFCLQCTELNAFSGNISVWFLL